MKIKSNIKLANAGRLILSAGLALACLSAGAQGIVRKSEAYQPQVTLPIAPPAAAIQPVQVASLPAAPASAMEITIQDRSVREALARWAKAEGWTHEPSHWTIDKDHPIEGIAGPEVFGSDFKVAVRKLLASTDLTDRPVQPCFYTNRVVRVIPKAQFCDRTAD